MPTSTIQALQHFWRRLRSRSHVHYIESLSSSLADCPTVLDLGCGSRPFLGECPNVERIIGIESWFESCQTASHAHKYVGVAQAVLPSIPVSRRSVDAVVLLQVLEHLPRAEGSRLLEAAEQIARRRVVVTTPNGYVSQGGYEGNPYQQHLSSWSIDDFISLGYQVFGLEGPKSLRRWESAQLARPAGLWQIVVSLGVFESYLRSRPDAAFQLMAVKTVEPPA